MLQYTKWEHRNLRASPLARLFHVGISGVKVKQETREYTYGARWTDDIVAVRFSTYERVKKLDQIKTTWDYYYEKNHLGSVVRITSSTGAVTDEYSYTVFWKAYRKNVNWVYKPVAGANDSAIWNTRLFTWREYDKEISLYYLRARYYDAWLWRFVSRDPIGMRDNVNLYTYVANSPINYVDRMGLEKVLIMYSPNHWYDRFDTTIGADTIKQAYLDSYDPDMRYRISVTAIETFEDFKRAIEDFNNDGNYKHGEIVYIWHNQGWLSKNLTNENISQLNQLEETNRMILLGCSTFIDPDDNNVTWSNQIGQKLANQLDISVSWSDKPVYYHNWWSDIQIIQDSWHTANPGWILNNETSILDTFISKLF